jgi:hypothetical protein
MSGVMTKLLATAALYAATSLAQGVEGSIVNSVTGQGIAGLEVTILKGVAVLFTRYTDTRGQFVVNELSDGEYAAAYSSLDYSPNLMDSHPTFAREARGLAQPFRIAGPDTVKLEARMIPSGRLAGRVLDGRGDPVPRARLQLNGARLKLLMSADDHGNFDQNIPPGSYKLSAVAVADLKPPDPDPRSGQPQRWARTYYPGVGFEELASDLLMRPGVDVTGIEIKLVAVPAHAIRGKILYEDGSPASKVTLNLGEGFPNWRAQSTESRQDGTFEFEGVTDGRYEIATDFKAGDVDLRANEWVELLGHDLDRVGVTLAAPFNATGKVSIETNEGTPAPKPPGIVSLDEVSHRTQAGMGFHLWANPDSQGNFRITHVYPGTYIVSDSGSGVSTTAAGFAGAPLGYFLDSIRAGDVELPDHVVRLTGPLPITLIYKSNGGIVRGAVEHCGSGTVWLFPRDATLWRQDFFKSATCDASDHYDIIDVRPREYYALALSATSPSPFADGAFDETLLGQAVPVTVHAGEAVAADLHLVVKPAF